MLLKYYYIDHTIFKISCYHFSIWFIANKKKKKIKKMATLFNIIFYFFDNKMKLISYVSPFYFLYEDSTIHIFYKNKSKDY